MLTFIAVMVIVFGVFSAVRVQAQKVSQNPLDGNWKNVDTHTRGIDAHTRNIDKIVIAEKKVHPFGVCYPQGTVINGHLHTAGNGLRGAACDWGVLKMKIKRVASSGNSNYTSKLVLTHPTKAWAYDRMARISYEYNQLTPWMTVDITISLLPDGRLRVDTITRFIDGSRRAKYGTVNYFRRVQSPVAP
jgi:hypothetical protein